MNNEKYEIVRSLNLENIELSSKIKKILSDFRPSSLSRYLNNFEEIQNTYNSISEEIEKISKIFENKKNKRKNKEEIKKLEKYITELNKSREYLDEFQNYIKICSSLDEEYNYIYKKYQKELIEKDRDIEEYREFSKIMKKYFNNIAIKAISSADIAYMVYQFLDNVPISDGARTAISFFVSGLAAIGLYPSVSWILDKYEKRKIINNDKDIEKKRSELKKIERKYKKILKEAEENLFLKIDNCFPGIVKSVVYKKANGKIKIEQKKEDIPKIWGMFDEYYE